MLKNCGLVRSHSHITPNTKLSSAARAIVK